MKKLMVLILTLASAFSQVSDPGKPVVAPQDLEKKIDNLQRALQIAERNSTKRSATDREKTIQETQAAIKAAEKNLGNQVEGIGRQAQKSSDDQLRTSRNAWYITWGLGGGSLAVLLVIFLLILKKNRKKEVTSLTSTEPEQKTEQKNEILTDPNLFDLKAWSERNNGISRVPFILTLKEECRQFNCWAELREGIDPLVYFEGRQVPVEWKKRRLVAVRITTYCAS